MINPRIDLSIRAFCMSRNSGWTPDEQIDLSDPIRRSLNCVRFNPSVTRLCPIQPVGQEPEPDQPARTEGVCPTLPKPRVGRPSSGSTQPDGHPNFDTTWPDLIWYRRERDRLLENEQQVSVNKIVHDYDNKADNIQTKKSKRIGREAHLATGGQNPGGAESGQKALSFLCPGEENLLGGVSSGHLFKKQKKNRKNF